MVKGGIWYNTSEGGNFLFGAQDNFSLTSNFDSSDQARSPAGR